MPFTYIIVSGEPKPGHEVRYGLAWKHRHIASGLMLRFIKRPWRWRAYRRAERMWSDAMRRFHKYGQDRVVTPQEQEG